MGYFFNAEGFLGGGEISVDLSQKGGATQKRLGTTGLSDHQSIWPMDDLALGRLGPPPPQDIYTGSRFGPASWSIWPT